MGHYSASDFPFKGSIGQLIGVSAATKDRILEKHLAALDITAAQFKVLIFVGLNRANSPVELCRELSVDSGSMTRMLARLEKKGLLLRGRRRCLRLDLSEAGRKVQEQLPLIASAAMNELVACLSTEELQTLTHLLTKVLLHAGCPRASLQES
ncbi:MarR family transcriptional regulator [Pseudomonas aeruginosa]|uniref:MarR family transcriptional regulator n=1 Tax=Pseudomonas aeruginosa TaxID=287 RepID=UPI00371C8340